MRPGKRGAEVEVSTAEVDEFRDLLLHQFGLRFDEDRRKHLSEVIRERVEELRLRSPGEYLGLLKTGEADEEWRELAVRLTVGETYFFRHSAQFSAFAEHALKERMAAGRDTINVLSAGCATGEEAYTVAIIAAELLGDQAASRVRITGIDVNPAALQKALRGRYSRWALREIPESLRDKYFQREGATYALDPAILHMVRFEERNLALPNEDFFVPERFDIIFCRNVTIYFSPSATRAVIAKFAHSLVPGGFLFLGHAETLRGISDEFHLRHRADAFYYQRRSHGEPRSLPQPSRTLSPRPFPVAMPLRDDSWVAAIHQAAQRIAALTNGSERPAGAAQATQQPRPGDGAPQSSLRGVLELFRQERYAEVLEHLDGLPAGVSGEVDAQLIQAAVLTNQGKLKEAETVCERVLALDEFNAGAHYLMALCRENAGDLEAAAEHDRVAIYLDPTFSMARLHLGLLSKRRRDATTARRELEEALALLVREDAARLLLFGGGFGREAIVEICRAELRTVGGEA